MITSKHIEKIVVAVVSVAVILCILASVFSDTLNEKFGSEGITQQYETELFDTSKNISVNIIMDSDKWNEMLENAIEEEYFQCDVEINGKTFYSVGIRTKGNTSLSTIANDPTTNRYSFKLEFDKYVDGQTCFGLDKLVLNNNYADATNMKEAVVYDMFAYLGADASLYNFADISVNGETWGVYLALEAVEDSFMLRNYGVSSGNLYKPENMEMGGKGKDFDKDFSGKNSKFDPSEQNGNASQAEENDENSFSDNKKRGGFEMPKNGEMPELPDGFEMPENGEMPELPDGFEMPENGEMPQMPDGGGFGGGGSDLNYIDDELDSYSSIWNGEVTSSKKSDRKRVVEALKNISEQNDVESYLDVDNMIKYMAVHTFAVNLDSLSGSMTHNYYLYEKSGKLNLIPWDYNLAFGGFSQGRSDSGATSTVNFPIDTPFSSEITLDDRQIFAAILENEEYLAQYHECLRVLCEEYVDSGRFDELYSSIRSRIDTLVKNDPNAFYDYDEYDEAALLLKEVVTLRAQSIKGQLEGTIPSTNDGQAENSSALIDASHIDLSILGTMNMGGMGGKDFNKKQEPNSQQKDNENKETTEADSENTTNSEGGSPFSPGMPDAAANSKPDLPDGIYPSADGKEAFAQGSLPPDKPDKSGKNSPAEKDELSSSIPVGEL